MHGVPLNTRSQGTCSGPAHALLSPHVHCCQVSEGERKVEYDNLFRDVAGVLVEKCVDPNTQRPYTLTMLERALRDAHFSIDPKRSAKQQALEVRATGQTG